MRSNIEVVIGVAITAKEWDIYKPDLMASFSNLRSVFGDGCVTYVVIQDESFAEQLFFQTEIEWLYVSKIKTLGVSNARNLCIEKSIELKSTFLLFHDATIYWPLNAVQFICKHKYNHETPRVNVVFNYPPKIDVGINGSKGFDIVKADPMYNPYVWSYLLRVNRVNAIRFDTNYGPGTNTRYKSGEDVIFLFNYFNKNNAVIISNDKDIAIYHPPRPSDFSKHLLYAYGQGALFRELFKRHLSFKLLVDCVLFFGNAIFRCFLLKKNSFSILLNRLKGFIGV